MEVDRKLIGYSGNGSGTHRENSGAYSEGKISQDRLETIPLMPQLSPIYSRSTADLLPLCSRPTPALRVTCQSLPMTFPITSRPTSNQAALHYRLFRSTHARTRLNIQSTPATLPICSRSKISIKTNIRRQVITFRLRTLYSTHLCESSCH